jgi:NAD(P)-dependent dehydrogenase (short-subunit alcohol dehydrogenase family)
VTQTNERFISLFDLTGKSALVTGGAMGLGRACANALAMAGANVAIIDVNEEVGLKTAASIKAQGVDAFFCAVTSQSNNKCRK